MACVSFISFSTSLSSCSFGTFDDEKTCFLPIFLDTCIASFFPAFQFSACALILIILAVFCDKKQHIFSPFSLGRIALLECKYNFFLCCNALCFFTFVHILVMLSWTGQCQLVIGLFFYFSKSFGFILDDRAKRTCSHPSTSTSQWTEGEFDAREQKKIVRNRKECSDNNKKHIKHDGIYGFIFDSLAEKTSREVIFVWDSFLSRLSIITAEMEFTVIYDKRDDIVCWIIMYWDMFVFCRLI